MFWHRILELIHQIIIATGKVHAAMESLYYVTIHLCCNSCGRDK
ncbi:hypothetical protein ECN1_2644 [Escherichia coli N1]|nr:hypothetical protein ECN1_2644 [Escherichia coli N1]